MERNNMFKYATKELSQDAFICWLINYINTNDEPKYKELAKDFINLIVDKIGSIRLKKFVTNNDYKVEIKHQYKNIDILLKIGEFYIIIEDKIKRIEHDDQINDYVYKLMTEGINDLNIYTCYYKIYEEYGCKEKYSAIINRKDMITLLQNAKKRNMFMEDYYSYLKEIEDYSKKRDILTSDICKEESTIVNHIEDSIYMNFYSELEEKEESYNIIGWGYADNKSGGTWWYASKKYKNVKSEEFDKIYAEINLKNDRNFITIKLAKKCKNFLLDENEKIEEKLSEEYFDNGKIKYIDISKVYKKNIETGIDVKYYYGCYKNLKEKVDIYNKVIKKELLEELAKFDIHENNINSKGNIRKNNSTIYKYNSRIATIDINKFTLKEVEEILNIINNYLEKLYIEI